MIDLLTYTELADSNMPWAAQLDYFKRSPVTEFKPGLNILFGGNGSGKSTVLQMLGQTLAATQGGTSVVTSSWISDVVGFGGSHCKLPCSVVHDGQPVMFFDARAKEGLVGGSFDDDFFSLGVANAMAKGSTGQLGFRRLERLLKVLLDAQKEGAAQDSAPKPEAVRAPAKGKRTAKSFERKAGAKSLVPQGFPAEIEWKVSRDHLNAHWKARFDVVEQLLAAKRPQGPKTLLFDEPESGFSLPWQAGLWSNMFSKVDPEKHQVIVATHSPFALGIDGANYIEMTPGYLLESKVALMSLMNRFFSQKDSA